MSGPGVAGRPRGAGMAKPKRARGALSGPQWCGSRNLDQPVFPRPPGAASLGNNRNRFTDLGTLMADLG